MKSAWIGVVLLCLVVASSAFATPRQLGMGGVGIGIADDAAAWGQNPAGLADLNIQSPNDGALWEHDVIGAFGDMNDGDIFSLTWSGWQPDKMMGVGAGILDIDEDIYEPPYDYELDSASVMGRRGGTSFGVGYGTAYKATPFSWGANVIYENPEVGDSNTFINLGLMYRLAQAERAPIRIGLLIEDLLDDSDNGPYFSIGAGWWARDDLLIGVDIRDITDEIDTAISGGAELVLGRDREWRARAGLMDSGSDHDLTLGVGYAMERWRVDFGWADLGDDTWLLGAGLNF